MTKDLPTDLDGRSMPHDARAGAGETAALRAEVARLRRELSAARATGAWLASGEWRDTEDGASNPAARLGLLEAMLETVPVGVVLADAEGRIVHGNAWVERMLKHPVLHSADTESYGEWVSFHADGRQVESHEYPLSRVIRDGEDHSSLDVHYRRGDGTMFWMRVIGEPVRDAQGRRIGATVALVDIDDEMQLLQEKEVLLGEVNHRVKNSLQIVSAILSMQARGTKGEEGADLLRAASARVRAVAAVHAALYHDDDVRTVEFGAHLRTFCAQLADGAGAGARGIALDVVTEPVTLSAEKAVSLSLIVNELVTNAFKYAFPEDTEAVAGTDAPRIRVALSRTEGARVVLEVSDNGRGAGAAGGADEMTGGLGSTLVATMARQLHATVTRELTGGWSVRLEFDAA